MPIFVNVAGVQQKSTRPTVNVAGVNQRLKEGWVNVAGVQRKFFSAEDDLVMISATNANDFGFASGGFGSMTPNTLGDGATVDQCLLSQHLAANPDTFQLFLNTIPGPAVAASYLTSISLNGTVLVPSGANFSFSSGVGSASWTWTGQRFLFPGGGATVQVIVIRS